MSKVLYAITMVLCMYVLAGVTIEVCAQLSGPALGMTFVRQVICLAIAFVVLVAGIVSQAFEDKEIYS